MSEDLKLRHARRKAFLRKLYDRVGASVSQFVDVFEVGASLEMDRDASIRVLEYLEEKGLVKVDDYQGGMARLTAEGVDAVELGN